MEELRQKSVCVSLLEIRLPIKPFAGKQGNPLNIGVRGINPASSMTLLLGFELVYEFTRVLIAANGLKIMTVVALVVDSSLSTLFSVKNCCFTDFDGPGKGGLIGF